MRVRGWLLLAPVPWLLTLLEPYAWLGAVFAELHVQVALVLFAAAIAAAFYKQWLGVVLGSVGGLALLAPLWPLVRAIRPTPAHGPTLSVVQLDLAEHPWPVDKLASWLVQSRVEALSLTHLTAKDARALHEPLAGYQTFAGRDDHALLLTKASLVSHARRPGWITTRVGSCNVDVIQVTLPSLLSPSAGQARKRQLDALLHAEVRRRSVYLGAFGSRSAAHDLRALLDDHELRDARLGHGRLATHGPSIFGLPVDHALVHGWIAVSSAGIGAPPVAGAHHPLHAQLELTEPRCR